ncbi:MAG: hypothetical protein R2713_00720 [Ilumatobacteraceae bacterium]
MGTYNPRVEPSAINIDSDKAVKWLMEGAAHRSVKKLLGPRAPGRLHLGEVGRQGQVIRS